MNHAHARVRVGEALLPASVGPDGIGPIASWVYFDGDDDGDWVWSSDIALVDRTPATRIGRELIFEGGECRRMGFVEYFLVWFKIKRTVARRGQKVRP